MGSLGSERRLRGKPAISLAPRCRTWRTSLPWPHAARVHSGLLTAFLLDPTAVRLQELWGFGRASPCRFKIDATGSWLGWGGETAGCFCATSQTPTCLAQLASLVGVPSSAHISAFIEVWDLNNRIFLFL